MIYLVLNRRDFEYDIYSLIKAFYTGAEIRVFDAWENIEDSQEGTSLQESDSDISSGWELLFDVFFDTAETIRSVSLNIFRQSEREQPFAADRIEIVEDMTRIQVKSAVKTLLYKALCNMTGRTLPWGDLTGIRPVKLAMSRILAGDTNAQTARFLREVYHVSPQKSALAVMIANKEKYLLDGMDYRNGYSLYIGIPFCPSICLYCSFSSSPIGLWKSKTDDYLDALEKEMRGTRDVFSPKILQTVYIGGGTPTTLSSEQLDRLLCMVEDNFDLSRVREFTVEAGRPDSVTEDKLKVLAAHGTGRISINPQTMNQKTLDLIGRRHTVEQIEETFYLARSLGFDNINMDLIVGLPGEGPDEVAYTMERIGVLGPDSVTVHALALKRSSRLNEKLADYEAISFQASDEIMDLTMRQNEERGLYPYYLYRQKNMAGNFENVGYAVPGKECLYNILIMEEVQSILALGAGGSTKLVYDDGLIERIENVKDIKNYIERTDEMIDRKRNGTVKYHYSQKHKGGN